MAPPSTGRPPPNRGERPTAPRAARGQPLRRLTSTTLPMRRHAPQFPPHHMPAAHFRQLAHGRAPPGQTNGPKGLRLNCHALRPSKRPHSASASTKRSLGFLQRLRTRELRRKGGHLRLQVMAAPRRIAPQTGLVSSIATKAARGHRAEAHAEPRCRPVTPRRGDWRNRGRGRSRRCPRHSWPRGAAPPPPQTAPTKQARGPVP